MTDKTPEELFSREAINSRVKSSEEIERDGFIRQTVVALGANMAAATIHAGVKLDWTKIVGNSMEGAKEFWKAILEDRNGSTK